MFFKRKSYTHYSDEALMEEIALQNEPAFEVLYDRYGPRMYRFFLRMLWKNALKAEDFTQELFLKIIEKPTHFDTSRNFKTWIYTVATNLCKNEYRRNETLKEVPSEDLDIWSETLEEQLDAAWHEAQLRRRIDQLNEPHRRCLVLRYQEELSVAEIAEILGCPEGTVKSRLHHAIKKLQTPTALVL